MGHSKLHEPKYVGPGIWYSIHILAANAKTQKEKESVVKQIRIIQENFPCQECKSHFWKYLQNHPPEDTIKGGPESLFLWTVNFHNAVNFRLGKPQITYDEAKSIYIEQSVFCTKASCDEEEEVKDSSPEIKKPILKSSKKLVPADAVNIYRSF
jgi:hypothetical protein